MINFARCANLKVFKDSSLEAKLGLIVQITEILALPDKAACRIRVNLESRNGIWDDLYIDGTEMFILQKKNACGVIIELTVHHW